MLFFESTQCTYCKRLTGYSAQLKKVTAFDPTDIVGEFTCKIDPTVIYKQCQNYTKFQVCNGMIEKKADAPPFCFACHFNNSVPSTAAPEHINCWRELETAKRRTLYTIDALGLHIPDRIEDPESGLEFNFKTDRKAKDHFAIPVKGRTPVMTGHNQGDITINYAEADEVVRAKAKHSMGEQYRTLLGHFRHEIGHFYWDQLIANNAELTTQFRGLFGDESQSYQDALDHYYTNGAPVNWEKTYISAYATMHPWEDWAETWAHYLHMLDTLETAQSFGLDVQYHSHAQTDVTDLALPQHKNFYQYQASIETILSTWIELTVALNSLNRSMGLDDAYPFVLYEPIREKIKFVHNAIHGIQTNTITQE